MKILIISQVFWPDSSSVSQHLTDLAESLSRQKNKVAVLSSRSSYEDSKIRYPSIEVHKNILIKRLYQTRFYKKNKLGRVLNFLTFNYSLMLKILTVSKNEYDLILGTTAPPLGAFFGVLGAKIKRTKFCYWALDLQPDLAIAAGYLKEKSLVSKVLLGMGNYIYRHSDLIIALDRFMAAHIQKKIGPSRKIKVIPVWPVHDNIYLGPRLDNPFRRQHGLGDKIVVMYSGNHSVMHPLDTLLEAALKLNEDERFLFVFIGSGVRKPQVLEFKSKHRLKNIVALPYQDRDKIHLSLGAADIHVVIHGNGCTGLTHPNKIYGAMSLGKPILYIGPSPSHITDILENCPDNLSIQHGERVKLANVLLAFADLGENKRTAIGSHNMAFAQKFFSRDILIKRTLDELEKLMPAETNENGQNPDYRG